MQFTLSKTRSDTEAELLAKIKKDVAAGRLSPETQAGPTGRADHGRDLRHVDPGQGRCETGQAHCDSQSRVASLACRHRIRKGCSGWKRAATSEDVEVLQ